MARVSKGKLKYIWSLYHIKELIAYRAVTAWYYEPNPVHRETVEKWLTRINAAIEAKPIHGWTPAPPDTGHYSGCRSIIDEADLEIFYSITPCANPVYLTLQRGRHRSYAVEPSENAKPLSFDYTLDATLMAHGIDQLLPGT